MTEHDSIGQSSPRELSPCPESEKGSSDCPMIETQESSSASSSSSEGQNMSCIKVEDPAGNKKDDDRNNNEIMNSSENEVDSVCQMNNLSLNNNNNNKNEVILDKSKENDSDASGNKIVAEVINYKDNDKTENNSNNSNNNNSSECDIASQSPFDSSSYSSSSSSSLVSSLTNCSSTSLKVSKDEIEVYVKWGGKTHLITFTPTDFSTFSVKDLRAKINYEFDIPVERQKFLGVSSGERKGPPGDEEMLCDLKWSNFNRLEFILIGTTRSNQMDPPPPREDSDEDYELEYSEAVINDMKVEIRLQTCLEKLEIRWIHPPLPSKHLLVLDLDYTLFDCKAGGVEMKYNRRPYLDYFLTMVHSCYDIVIWSQTGWHWVELKCTELGILTSPNYHICFVLDRSSMFTVSSRKQNASPHEVKALRLIWAKCKNWTPRNTIHVDDLSRNFALNPKNGLKVVPYKSAKREGDKELYYLAHYLTHMAKSVTDFRTVDHKRWRATTMMHAEKGSIPDLGRCWKASEWPTLHCVNKGRR